MTRADIASRLKDYRDGKQMGPKTPVMAAMAKPLTDEQIAALANYLGEQARLLTRIRRPIG